MGRLNVSHESVKIKIIYELNQIKEEVGIVKSIIKIERKRNLDDIEIRAIAGSIHSIYNGIEKILLFAIGEFSSEGNSWHSNLLKKCVESKIISENLEMNLRELMSFRHFYRHAYGFMLDNELLKPLYGSIIEIIDELKVQLDIEI